MHLRDIPSDYDFPRVVTVAVGDIERDCEVATIPLRPKHIEKLRAKFKPHLVGMPIVSCRADGTRVVLNGSHRCQLIRSMFGPDCELEVVEFAGLTREQEVALFRRHHKKYLPAAPSQD